MSEEEHPQHHHHSLFGHHKHGEEAENKPVSHFNEYPEAEEDAIPIERTEYYQGPTPSPSASASASHTLHRAHDNVQHEGGEDDAKKHEKSAAHKEHAGEALGVAAAAFAVHERQRANKDPEHAGRHKLEERIAEFVAVGAGGYAVHEHHEKNEAKKEEEQHEGGEEHAKKHHLF